MRFLAFAALALTFLLTLAPAVTAAARRPPAFPVPAGTYDGGYASSEGDEGSLVIVIDSRGRMTGTGETSDGTTFTLKGTLSVNQHSGKATGKVTFNGRDYKGSATVRIEGDSLTGTYRGRAGRSSERGTHALTRR